ncbi:hypothetical protein [Amycolatopsis viridis]|nr:hypothetical protein [Amycolatopsis viridis]
MSGGRHGEVASRRVFRRVRCPVCGEWRREMRVFGTPWQDEAGNIKPRHRIRAELAAQAQAWTPEPRCDRCRRL